MFVNVSQIDDFIKEKCDLNIKILIEGVKQLFYAQIQ